MLFSLFKKKNDLIYKLTWVTSQLAVGHAPMSHAELDSIKKQGIKGIMNLCLEIEELARFEQEQGFEVYYLPIMDEEFPDEKELEKALDWLDECIYLGKKVLIHCRHGIGRTGTVVFSYMLRKGLDKKSARKKMRHLGSQPTEQPQIRFLHKYGKKETPLKISQPSLIPGFKVELDSYLDRAGIILERIQADIPQTTARCGKEHTRCCYQSLQLTLAEAVYLQYGLNTELSRKLRQDCINRANQTHVSFCPLLQEESCLLYEFRPAQCRAFDRIDSTIQEKYAQELYTLSREILQAFLDKEAQQSPPNFNLSDVVSGKFVQHIFHLLSGFV